MAEADDFVGVIQSLTNFVQNQRVAAYNEAVDMMLDNARGWMRRHQIEPQGDDLPTLLEEIKEAMKDTK